MTAHSAMNAEVPVIRGAAFPDAAFAEDVVANNFLGRRMMIINRPEGVHRVLVENAENYVRPNAAFRILGPPIGGGLFLSEGIEWRRQRALLAPSFTPRVTPPFARHVAEEAASLVDRLAVGTEAVDLFAPLQSLTLSVAASALFSMDIGDRLDAIRALAADYSERLGRPDLFDFLMPLWVPVPRDAARLRFRRRWRRLIAQLIEDRHQRAVERPDLFDLLAASEAPRGLFDKQVATMLITGSETTGAAAFWSIYLVASAPAVQQRIAAETQRLDLGADAITTSLPQLIYTRAVVQEAMRLYPPAFSIVRQALQPDVADGIAIPAGAIVQTAPWVLHRHLRFWANPALFDPERFLPGATLPPRGVYIPFGLGPRLCIGAQFAMIEATVVLAAIVRSFHITPTTAEPVRPVARITLQPDNPAPFRLQRREAAAR